MSAETPEERRRLLAGRARCPDCGADPLAAAGERWEQTPDGTDLLLRCDCGALVRVRWEVADGA